MLTPGRRRPTSRPAASPGYAGTWSWRLTEEEPGRTRVVTRIRAVHDWKHPMSGLLSLVLLELGDFAMLRRMLRGIRSRAELAPRG